MSFSPGRNVGRTSVRVVPDTTRFRLDAKRRLDRIEKTLSMTVRVDKAKVDNRAVRESIRRQMAEFKDLDLNANVQVVVDSARLAEGKLRKSIQAQFDQMDDVRVHIQPIISQHHQQQFQHQVNQLVRQASRNTVQLGVNAHTAAATAQLRYATRPRWVQIFVRVNKSSLAAATATLAALSGARLSWKWIDDLMQKMRELDRNLPKILNWTSGLTALVAAIMGSVSGLVGIGQGLFTILPAFLTVPGLILNAVGSLTVLVVALKHAKDELGVLSDDMNELGSIIRHTFWDQAREPIIGLVQGLMPQLRNSFRELSQGVGEFTAAMAKAFGEELAGGRLEGIFKGIAEGWRILGSGAKGFAGALVSLSEIAATYTPRLATWFVRQANTFDAWLEAIAKDGRLGAWMEQSVRSMYDLWDATRGVAGVFTGLWKAADQAGSGGLRGFGQMMLEWRRVVHSADFQRGLSAIFRGSYVAMDAFGDALRSLGRLIANMPDQFERFVGSVGGFLGGIFDAAFRALDNVQVAIGLDKFSSGLDTALARIGPSLQPIADTFGRFLGLLGDVAATLLPTAVGVLADLMPTIDGLAAAIAPVLPTLADALADISAELAPALADFVTAASPLFRQVVSDLAESLVSLTPAIVKLVSVLNNVVTALGEAYGKSSDFWKGLQDATKGGEAGNWSGRLRDLIGDHLRNEDGFVFRVDKIKTAEEGRNAAEALAREYRSVLERKGPEAGDAFLQGLAQIKGIPAPFKSAILDALPELEQFSARGREGGAEFNRGVLQGVGAGGGMSVSLAQQLDIPGLSARFGEAGATGGTLFSGGVRDAITSGAVEASAAARTSAQEIVNQFSGSDLLQSGMQMMGHLSAGISSGAPVARAAGDDARAKLTQLFNGIEMVLQGFAMMTHLAGGIKAGGYGVRVAGDSVRQGIVTQFATISLYGVGVSIMAGLAAGIRSNAHVPAAAAVSAANRVVTASRHALVIESPSKRMENEVGRWVNPGTARGIRKNMNVVTRAAEASVDFDLFRAFDRQATPDGKQINITMPLLPGETPQEQRDNLVRELRYA